jgi:hypothetical protein
MSQEPDQHGDEEYYVSHQGGHSVDQALAHMQGDATPKNWGVRSFHLLFA